MVGIVNCELPEVKRCELTVERFFPQSNRTFKQRDISETVDFFDIAHGGKIFLFDHITFFRDEPTRLGPTLSYRSLTAYFSVNSKDINLNF